MRIRRSGKLASAAALALAAVGWCFLWHVSARAAERGGWFGADPHGVANRLYVLLHTRTSTDDSEFGLDALDPLLWNTTNYLLTGPAHTQALALADEFLRTHAEREVTDPLRRAILQRDVWAVYDWAQQPEDPNPSHVPERRALAAKLGPIVRRLALSPDELDALPDTYAEAIQLHEFPAAYDAAFPNRGFSPPDLFDPAGQWVCLGAPEQQLAAPMHDREFSARSAFLVYAKLPGGREATLAYYKQLAEMTMPLFVQVADPQIGPLNVWNQQVPQFPIGTEFALVRRMILPDRDGVLHITKVTESVQIRHYSRVPAVDPLGSRDEDLAIHSQSPSEIALSRELLFSGGRSGLRGMTAEDKSFLMSPALVGGFDPFEDLRMRKALQISPFVMCSACHLGPGIQSMMSFSARAEPSDGPVQSPKLRETTPAAETGKVLEWARGQDSWKRLRAWWARQDAD